MMKIDSKFSQSTAPVANRNGTQARVGSSAAPSADAVSLSALSSSMQSGEKPPVNSARIQEIKDAISQGRFKINPEAIASGLIESARELVSTQRKA